METCSSKTIMASTSLGHRGFGLDWERVCGLVELSVGEKIQCFSYTISGSRTSTFPASLI